MTENAENAENSYISYKIFKNIKNSYYFGPKRIPKIIFRTAEFDINHLPEPIVNVLNETNNKSRDYIQVYFDSKSRITFLKENFPKLLKHYNVLKPGAFKADLIRLLLLYKYGGVYNDIGSTYYVDISTFIKDSDELVLTKDYVDKNRDSSVVYGLANGFMASYKKHPIIKKMLDLVVNNISNKFYGTYCLDITGPMAIGRAFNLFFNRDEVSEIKAGTYTMSKQTRNINKSKQKRKSKKSKQKNEVKYKIKMFKFNGKIIKYDRKNFIRVKFPGYNELMYKKGPNYCDMWHDSNIYN